MSDRNMDFWENIAELKDELSRMDDLVSKLSATADAQEAEIKRLREERRWISVEERVPERGVRVLVTLTPDSKGKREVCEAVMKYEQFFETDYGSYEATHWMPLPSPPEEKE